MIKGIPERVQNRLICPKCHGRLRLADALLLCSNKECQASYPLVDGVPVLINEQNSVFAIEDFLGQKDTTYRLKEGKLKQLLERMLVTPGIDFDWQKKAEIFFAEAAKGSSEPVILVVGGRTLSKGMSYLVENKKAQWVEMDVSFGPRTGMIADAHDIPFEDFTFDGVVVQNVLEHVLDPHECVENIHRVLKPGGVVYADTPFMQQVHGGAYDFNRFTHLGHRRLFRCFDEIASGVSVGPGAALAWSWEHFLLSFASKPVLRLAIKAFARLTSFYLPWVDFFLRNFPGGLDAASAYYFVGVRSDAALQDKDLVSLYRGLKY